MTRRIWAVAAWDMAAQIVTQIKILVAAATVKGAAEVGGEEEARSLSKHRGRR